MKEGMTNVQYAWPYSKTVPVEDNTNLSPVFFAAPGSCLKIYFRYIAPGSHYQLT